MSMLWFILQPYDNLNYVLVLQRPLEASLGGGNASMDHLPLNHELGKESHWDIIDKEGLPRRG